MSLTVGSLFSGIGGFDLAAQRIGWEIKWQVEIDPYCTKVLEKHWPHVRRYDDIKRLRYPVHVDVVCGGFPCQDISHAGKRVGITGKRSGLWGEMARIIRAVRPRYVVVENVSALLTRGLGRVLGDLAACGYDAEWDCIPASAVGAPHRRDRVWLVAYPNEPRLQGRQCSVLSERASERAAWAGGASVAFTTSAGCDTTWTIFPSATTGAGPLRLPTRSDWWRTEPNVGRVAHGVPKRVDRLRGLGDAIVPQVAEWIFRQIQAHEDRRIA